MKKHLNLFAKKYAVHTYAECAFSLYSKTNSMTEHLAVKVN